MRYKCEKWMSSLLETTLPPNCDMHVGTGNFRVESTVNILDDGRTI
jgi:hypothetical protein